MFCIVFFSVAPVSGFAPLVEELDAMRTMDLKHFQVINHGSQRLPGHDSFVPSRLCFCSGSATILRWSKPLVDDPYCQSRSWDGEANSSSTANLCFEEAVSMAFLGCFHRFSMVFHGLSTWIQPSPRHLPASISRGSPRELVEFLADEARQITELPKWGDLVLP